MAHHDFSVGMNAYFFFKTHNRETGQDLVQSTFMKTWSYLAGGGKFDLMKAFLYHVLNNLIVDEYRKHKTESLDVLLENGFEPYIDYTKRIYDIFDGKAALGLLEHLPAKYQKILRMRYKQQLSINEISLITGQTRNAVAVQAHRGLNKLKLLHNQT